MQEWDRLRGENEEQAAALARVGELLKVERRTLEDKTAKSQAEIDRLSGVGKALEKELADTKHRYVELENKYRRLKAHIACPAGASPAPPPQATAASGRGDAANHRTRAQPPAQTAAPASASRDPRLQAPAGAGAAASPAPADALTRVMQESAHPTAAVALPPRDSLPKDSQTVEEMWKDLCIEMPVVQQQAPRNNSVDNASQMGSTANQIARKMKWWQQQQQQQTMAAGDASPAPPALEARSSPSVIGQVLGSAEAEISAALPPCSAQAAQVQPAAAAAAAAAASPLTALRVSEEVMVRPTTHHNAK